MKFYAISEKGRRKNNEDAYLAKKISSYYVFAVADGLGGHAAGEIASKIAVIELEETIKRFKGSPKEMLKKAIEKANEEVYLQSKEFADRKGMATTLVACILDENGNGIIANVGDSRAYLINDEIWHTKDHSYVQELVDTGVITEDEAFNHP
ncbi:serine/threonine protein phosphatase, partial [Archaeoglobales archaeon]